MSLLVYPKVIPWAYIKFSLKTLESFVFELCCGQTNKRTDSKILACTESQYATRFHFKVHLKANNFARDAPHVLNENFLET